MSMKFLIIKHIEILKEVKKLMNFSKSREFIMIQQIMGDNTNMMISNEKLNKTMQLKNCSIVISIMQLFLWLIFKVKSRGHNHNFWMILSRYLILQEEKRKN